MSYTADGRIQAVSNANVPQITQAYITSRSVGPELNNAIPAGDVGTITDAVYARPHGALRLAELGHAFLDAELALIASWAVAPTSTPRPRAR